VSNVSVSVFRFLTVVNLIVQSEIILARSDVSAGNSLSVPQ